VSGRLLEPQDSGGASAPKRTTGEIRNSFLPASSPADSLSRLRGEGESEGEMGECRGGCSGLGEEAGNKGCGRRKENEGWSSSQSALGRTKGREGLVLVFG